MKIHSVFIIMVVLGNLNVAQGQPYGRHERNILRFTVPAENHFIDKNTEHIAFLLNSDTVSFVRIEPKRDDTAYLNQEFLEDSFGRWKTFFFDLGFAADRLVFAKKYPRVSTPVVPHVEIKNIDGSEHEGKLYKISSIDFYRDSTRYTYDSNTSEKEIEKGGFGYGKPARYADNLDRLANEIAREVRNASIRVPSDSILVFQAVVRRFDRLTGYSPFELEGLLYGKSSTFSEIVTERLRAKENNVFDDGTPKWIAASGDRPMNTRIKIYVELTRDGSVIILLPRYLGSWTGD